MSTPPTRRVVVTSPKTKARRSGPAYRVATEIDEQTELGHVYMRSLISTQLRLGLMVCLSVCGTLALLPLVFALFPALGGVSVLGIRLPWLLLGALVYPALVIAGWWYMRRAEANERYFADHVKPM